MGCSGSMFLRRRERVDDLRCANRGCCQMRVWMLMLPVGAVRCCWIWAWEV